MSRAVRRVPPDWAHPQDEQGEYIPLHDGARYAREVERWDEGAAKWEEGLCRNYETGEWEPIPADLRGDTYAGCEGERPEANEYMPQWSPSECTHWQMYEEVTEGTPISPVCHSPEELAQWLADHDANAFADTTASYRDWLALIRQGSAPSSIVSADGLKPGFASE